MSIRVFESESIGLQIRKYREMIEAAQYAQWADILGIELVDPSDLQWTVSIKEDPSSWWNKIGRATAMHINKKKLRAVFPMNNGEVAGLALSMVMSMHHLGFLRKLVEEEFSRTSSLTLR